ncbi:MAG: VWA domain-containing protein [Spirochaetales bacterium]|nr:VWA domain-containing protein [Spirochaetales bacterium]
MNKNSGGIVFLIIIGIIGFIIISIILEENDANNVSVTTPYDTDVTETEATQTGWPPGIDNPNMELAENKLKKNYYLILDGSGSMSGEKMKTAKKALSRFINLVPDDANIGLAVFDSGGLSERAPLGSSKEQLVNQIQRVNASGYTPLESSLALAYKQINKQAARQLGYGEYNIVVVTDGEASDGEEPGPIVNEILRESPVVIHTIGFQIGEQHSLNQPGRILYKSANNLEELSAGLGDVLAEMEDFSVTEFDGN